MKEQDKREIRQIFNEGFEQLILSHFDNLYKSIDEIKKNMATKKDIEDVRGDIATLQTDVENIDRKLDTEISWRDGASKRLKKVEVKLGFAK
ncbi:hypothetical protein KKG24_04680 [Patescibacteria group bacterium]|nr:hypothetical protein [Patescibacteria group bacterium]